MPKKDTNIYLRKDGRWEARYLKHYTEDKKIVYGYIYGESHDSVEEKLRKLKANNDDSKSYNSDMTFSELSLAWLTNLSVQVKKSTLSCYTYSLNASILPVFGDMKLAMVTTERITAFTRDKLEPSSLDTDGLSAKTVRDLLTIIKSILDFGASMGLVDAPANIVFPKNRRKEIIVFSRQEQNTLEKFLLRDYCDGSKLAILICLYTGLRLGEVCALQWRDIDIENQIIYVRKTVQRIKSDYSIGAKTSIIVDAPKSDASLRQVPAPDLLICHLKRVQADEDAYILTSQAHPFDLRTLQNHFKYVLKDANVKPTNFHTLRHTFATRCIEAGVDVKSLSEILGHSNVNLTLNRYVHSSIEQKRESMNKLVAFIHQ